MSTNRGNNCKHCASWAITNLKAISFGFSSLTMISSSVIANIYKQFAFAKEGPTIIQHIFSNSGDSGTAAAPRMIRSSIACPKWRTHHGSMGTIHGDRSKIDALITSDPHWSIIWIIWSYRVPNFETTFEVLYPSWNGWWLSPNLRHPFKSARWNTLKHAETRGEKRLTSDCWPLVLDLQFIYWTTNCFT